MSINHKFAVSVAPSHHGADRTHHTFLPQTQSLSALAAVAPSQAALSFDLHVQDTDANPELKKAVDGAKNGPCIVFAVLGDGVKPTPHSKDNATSNTGIGLDFDQGTLDESATRTILDPLGIAYWSYSSFRHHSSPDPSKPWQKRKWRIVIPYARPATAGEHAAAFEFFAQLFRPHLLDTACRDVSRLFYLPRVPAGSQHYQSWLQDGELYNPPLVQPKALGRPSVKKAIDAEVLAALSAVRFPDDSGVRHDLWQKYGHALKRAYGDDGLAHWTAWSAQHPSYDEARCQQQWAGFGVSGDGVGIGTIFHHAKQAGWVSPSDQDIETLNRELFVGRWGKRTAVFQIRDEEGAVPIVDKDLVLEYGNRFVQRRDQRVPLYHFWKQHPQRRQYRRVAFEPSAQVKQVDHVYNLWTGFAVTPKQGSWMKLREHLRYIICAGDPDAYTHLMCWLADLVQNPARPGGHAIVLQSKAQGAGKGIFMQYLAKIFGRHFMPFNKADQVVGRFNGHMSRCLVGFADEAFFAGSHETKNALKAMITEPFLSVEYKGVDIEKMPNYTHWVLGSNETWVARIEPKDRRFFCLEVSDAKVGDAAYFAELESELNGDGPAAFLYYLLNRVDPQSVGYNRYHPPTTRLHLKQKLHSMTYLHQWWHSVLCDGSLGNTHAPAISSQPVILWPSRIAMFSLLTEAKSHGSMSNGSRDVTMGRMHELISELVPNAVIGGGNVILPSLVDCRTAFEECYNAKGMTDDLRGAGRVASCCHRICPSLSSRAQSSRPWQSVDPGRAEVFGWGCVSLSTSATRWVTQLLPSSGRMTVGRDFGHYGVGLEHVLPPLRHIVATLPPGAIICQSAGQAMHHAHVAPQVLSPTRR